MTPKKETTSCILQRPINENLDRMIRKLLDMNLYVIRMKKWRPELEETYRTPKREITCISKKATACISQEATKMNQTG